MSFWTEKPSSFPLQRFQENGFHKLYKRFILIREFGRRQGRISAQEPNEASQLHVGRAGFNLIKQISLSAVRQDNLMLI